MTSFFRYPGGKSKLKETIIKNIRIYATNNKIEYREPFFGGGSIGLNIIKDGLCNKIWINDKDLGVASLWTCVISFPEELKKKVMSFTPSVEKFYEYKKQLLENNSIKSDKDVLNYGFKKLAVHQISYSGLGTKSGGPLGGEKQKSIYKVDCRWSPSYICKKIDKLHDQFNKMTIREKKCTSVDFEDLILCKNEAIIYLDPPYYEKGGELYQCSFDIEDHKRLSKLLMSCRNPWVLSYDDCEEIRKLYSWASIQEINVNYSITALKDDITKKRTARTKTELLISTKEHIKLLKEKSIPKTLSDYFSEHNV